MIRSMKLKRARGLAVILALMAMILCGGCGNDGRSHSGLAQQPGPQDPAVTGVVRAPNGRLTAVDRLIRWAKDFSLIFVGQCRGGFPSAVPRGARRDWNPSCCLSGESLRCSGWGNRYARSDQRISSQWWRAHKCRRCLCIGRPQSLPY